MIGAALVGLALGCAEQPAADNVPAEDTAAAPAPADTTPAVRPFVARDSIVFMFRVSEHEQVYFEPLFVSADGEPRSARMEQGTPEADRFEARYYAEGSRYHATSGGRPVGVIEIDGPALAGCTGLAGDAAFVDKVPASPMTGLAFPNEPAAHDFVTEPTTVEDSAARTAVLAELRELDVPEVKLDAVEWGPIVAVVGPEGHRTVVASGEVSAFDDAEMPAAGFAMLEQADSGLAVIQRESRDGRRLEGGRVEFFDAADLDGDGAPELVLQNFYFESWDFTIYRRSSSGWERIFHGGGSGC